MFDLVLPATAIDANATGGRSILRPLWAEGQAAANSLSNVGSEFGCALPVKQIKTSRSINIRFPPSLRMSIEFS